MAGDCGEPADVIGVHDRVAVNALEARDGEAGFDGLQGLGGEEAAIGGDDPDHFAFGLQGEHVLIIEEKVIASDAAYHFVRTVGGGGNSGQRTSDLARLAEKIAGAIDGLAQTIGADRFQKIVDGSGVEGFDGVLAEGGHHDNDRKVGSLEPADDFEAAELGHLKIEEDEIRFEVDDLAQGVFPVVGFAD